MRPSFYTWFSCAYGTFWLVLMGYAFLTHSHVKVSTSWMVAAPFLALIFAARKRASDQRASFYIYFSSGYGSIWMLLFALSIVGHQHMNAGEFGAYGFPIIAVVYALLRLQDDAHRAALAAREAAAVHEVQP